eukprot:m.245244 g.245244  ORF g.245244 m.245244 type:complete len:68 (-) comp16107_c1_seq1:29-232(-)
MASARHPMTTSKSPPPPNILNLYFKCYRDKQTRLLKNESSMSEGYNTLNTKALLITTTTTTTSQQQQ